jgi:hypothetical protein
MFLKTALLSRHLKLTGMILERSPSQKGGRLAFWMATKGVVTSRDDGDDSDCSVVRSCLFCVLSWETDETLSGLL